jgi:hypothetical protein
VLVSSLQEASILVAQQGIKVVQSEVHMRVKGRRARYAVAVALDGPHGPLALRQICVEDQRPLGTQEEIELLAWCIEWTYNYATTRRQEGD